MSTVKFSGNFCNLEGNFPEKGTRIPAFELTTAALETITDQTYKGKKFVLNIFPSLDTAVCATSVRKFNERAAKHPDTVVVCVSMDLPFAMGRFCTTEGIQNVVTASAFRNREFGKNFGVALVDGPLRGLLTRAVIVVDGEGKVVYSQLVDEITTEPDYDRAEQALAAI